MKRTMVVMCVAVLGFVGSVFADAPKVSAADARMQAEIRKAWQQGFEQGYQRANAYRDNQEAQKRARFIAARKKLMAERIKAKPEVKKNPEAKCPEAKRPAAKGPEAKRPEGRRGDRPMKGRRGPRKFRRGE